jgi:hypothetical protein
MRKASRLKNLSLTSLGKAQGATLESVPPGIAQGQTADGSLDSMSGLPCHNCGCPMPENSRSRRGPKPSADEDRTSEARTRIRHSLIAVSPLKTDEVTKVINVAANKFSDLQAPVCRECREPIRGPVFEFGGSQVPACEKCVRRHYRHYPKHVINEELKIRQRVAQLWRLKA